jgi:hypothetical protein
VQEKEAGSVRIIRLKHIFKNWHENASTGLIWLRYGESRVFSWTRW